MSRSMGSDRQRASVQSVISARILGESWVTDVPWSTKQNPIHVAYTSARIQYSIILKYNQLAIAAIQDYPSVLKVS